MKPKAVDLGAIIRDARRHGNKDFIIGNATPAQRRIVLAALVDGWGMQDTLRLLSQVEEQRVRALNWN